MKLQVLQDDLSQAVSIANRFTSTRSQLPVLANILFTAKKNKLKISATNLEMSINLSLGAKVEKDGEITLPSRVINDIVNNLNKGTVNISSEKEKVKLRSENFTSTISGMNSADFPSIPDSIGRKYISLPKEKMVDALSKVLFAVSSDETRPILTGVLCFSQRNKVFFVSTDGFRLSRKTFKINNTGVINKVIIPKSAFAELKGLIEEEDEIKIFNDTKNNQVIFKINNSILSTRVIQGDFPNYEKIIPKESSLKVDLDKKDLLQAVKLSSVFAKDSSNVIKLSIGNGFVEMSAESQYYGSQKTKIDARVEGKKMEIGFNYKFLQEFLQAVEGDDIVMRFIDSNSPGLFLDPKDKDFLHLIMPVKL